MKFSKFFSKKAKSPNPAPIRIAGIYVICSKLRLPKCGNPPPNSRRFVAEMTSGKHAVYHWEESESASSVDWDWHVFIFDHYATDAERETLPRYC